MGRKKLYLTEEAAREAKRRQQRLWVRETRARMRSALIRDMGGKCALCSETVNLTFDHFPDPTSWDISRMAGPARIRRYREDWEQGMLRLLCFPCNRQRGRVARGDQDDGAEMEREPESGPF